MVALVTLVATALAAPVCEAQEQVLRLRYAANTLPDLPLPSLGDMEVAFVAEPVYDGPVVRGALQTGPTKQDFVGFAADLGAGRLYMDANRNLDLTDERPYTTSSDRSWQSFGDVLVADAEGDTTRSYMVQMTFSVRAPGVWSAVVRSGWWGTLDLDGTKWRVAVVDNLDGVLDETDLLAIQPDDNTWNWLTQDHPSRLPFGDRIFFEGHAYTLKPEFVPGQKDADLVVTVQGWRPHLGELRIEGEWISRLILSGDATVVLDSPGAVVQVPVGRYRSQRIFVDDADGYGLCKADRYGEVAVTEGGATALKVGGPLGPGVTVTRRGSQLELGTHLMGIGGVPYTALGEGDLGRPAPRFVVYSGAKAIASGAFRYG
jgi:hypothetical protein